MTKTWQEKAQDRKQFPKILKQLKTKANSKNLAGMKRFSMFGDKRLGVSIPDLRQMAKEIGFDHQLALNLWQTQIPEAQILASMIDNPKQVTEKQMEAWVKDFQSWDVCDQTCMNLFEKTPFVLKKIMQWSKRKEEFVKRTAFALIACLAWHQKLAKDDFFSKFFPLIQLASTDQRNFVRKAVNWALRNIGKRNPKLNKEAVKLAKEIRKINSKSAKWIANDAIRELTSEKVQQRLNNEQ